MNDEAWTLFFIKINTVYPVGGGAVLWMAKCLQFSKKADTFAYLCLKIEKDDMELQPQNKINWVWLTFGCLSSLTNVTGKLVSKEARV